MIIQNIIKKAFVLFCIISFTGCSNEDNDTFNHEDIEGLTADNFPMMDSSRLLIHY